MVDKLYLLLFPKLLFDQQINTRLLMYKLAINCSLKIGCFFVQY